MKLALRRRWGLFAFGGASLLSLAKLLLQPMPGHYRVFTGAARALWSGQIPYGSDFGTGVGYYFYSPSCALFFFGPLTLLPEKAGLVLYMALSWAVFAWGALRLFGAMESESLKPSYLPSYRSWFWLAIAFQMAGGILASKLEILMTGITLLSGAWMIERRRLALSAFLLAMILNWKLQPLPIVGLLIIAWTLVERDWKWPSALAGSLAFWYALPYAVRPHELLSRSQVVWGATFGAFVRDSYLNFENLFAFARNSLGISLSFGASQAVSLTLGLAFAAGLSLSLIRERGTALRDPAGPRREGVLLSLALGSAFICSVSPLGQNNALILYAPLLLVSFHEFDRASGQGRTLWRLLLLASCLVMSLAYSDLVPQPLQLALRRATIKPVACLGLGLAILFSRLREPRQSVKQG